MQRYPIGAKIHIIELGRTPAENFCYGFVVNSHYIYEQCDDGEILLTDAVLGVKTFLRGKWQILVVNPFESVLQVIPEHSSEYQWQAIYEPAQLVARLVENYYAGTTESISFHIPRGGFEDGMESQASQTAEYLIKSNFLAALGLIGDLILYKTDKPELGGELLKVLGRIEHKPSYLFRRYILEKALESEYKTIRDGAVVGLSFMMDLHCVERLQAAIVNESIPELKEDMQQLLDTLNHFRKKFRV